MAVSTARVPMAAKKTAKKRAKAIPPEDRQQMIAEAAYYLAERRGFGAGGEVGDWLDAEVIIDAGITEERRIG